MKMCAMHTMYNMSPGVKCARTDGKWAENLLRLGLTSFPFVRAPWSLLENNFWGHLWTARHACDLPWRAPNAPLRTA